MGVFLRGIFGGVGPRPADGAEAEKARHRAGPKNKIHRYSAASDFVKKSASLSTAGATYCGLSYMSM